MMKLSVKRNKQFDRYLDLSLKMIPILVSMFLIGNVLFNISYFSSLRCDWSNLLTLSDYYEGSIIYLQYTLLMFLFAFLFYMFQKKGLEYFKKLLSYIWSIILLFFYTLLIIYYYVRIMIVRIVMIKDKISAFSIKRSYISTLKKMKLVYRLIFKYFLLKILGIIALVVLIGFLIMIFITVIYTLYVYNWFSLIIATTIYVNILLFIKPKSSILQNILLFVVIYLYAMWSIGGLSARHTQTYELPILDFISSSQTTYISTNKQQNLVLVRAINKGVIAEDNDKLYFFKWEDVEYLYQKKHDKK